VICLSCGYTLDGLQVHRCPECGRAFDPFNSRTFGPIARRTLSETEVRWLGRLYWMLAAIALGVFAPYLNYALAWVVLGHQPIPSADDPKFIRGIGWVRDLCMGWMILAVPVAVLASAVPLVIAMNAKNKRSALWWVVQAALPLVGVATLIAFRGRVMVWFAD